jgi:RHS repeat-associated protein
MPLASTWGDLVVGLDLHMVLVPTPGGPVPTLLPHPHLGMTGDPVGAVVSAMIAPLASLATEGKLAAPGGAVLVNGLPVMTTADLSRNAPLLRHQPMPPGTSFVSPPSGEGIHDLGSLTVAAHGAARVRGGELVRTCGDPAGLPTSTVVPIPKGRPVMVGGPPGVNLAQAAQAFVLGKVVRTAWGAASALARFVARHNATRLRNVLSRVQCVFTGHPVDVASGRVMTWDEDFRLPGPLPLAFERSYSSGWAARRGALGHGWSHSLERAVWVEPTGVVCRVSDGREIVFDVDACEGALPSIKREIRDPITGYTLMRTGAASWRVIDPDGIVDDFEPIAGESVVDGELPPIARVVRSSTQSGKVSIRYRYDNAGRLVSAEDFGGRVAKLEYDAEGTLTRVLLPDPVQPDVWIVHVAFRYRDGLLVEAIDALGQAMKYDYAGRLLVQETDRNGLSFYWGYDGRSSHARCVRTSGDGGIFNQKLDYDAKGRATVVTDSFGNRTLYKTNEIGLVTRVVAPDGGITETEYNDIGKPIAETDAAGNVTRWTYDRFGHVSVTIHPDGTKTICKRDRRFPELVAAFHNETGAIWRNRYDASGQLVESKAPDPGEVTSYEWHGGLLQAVVAPGGRRTEYTYDRHGDVVAVRFPNGAQIMQAHDRRGRRVRRTNPYGGREEVAYDLIGRAVRASTPDGNVWETTYDAQGNVREARDQLGQVRFTYAGFNWIASREEGDGTRADRVHFEHDLEGNLIEIRNEKNQPYRFSYDRCQRLVREIGFDMRATEYKRDRLGRAVRVTRPIGHTDTAYDSRGRLAEQKHSDGTWARFEYREDGLVTVAANQSATVRFDRDRAGRVIREVQGDDWVQSKYDTAGERSVMETSRGGRMAVIPTGGDGSNKILLGPLVGREQTEIALEYDALGLEVRRTLPGNVVATWERDKAGRPIVHQVIAGVAWSQTYSWAADDRLTSIADSRSGMATFHHDHRRRLHSADFPDGTTQYRAPDELGNLYRTPDRTDRRYLRGGMPRRAGDTIYEFDANGNLASKGEASGQLWRYTWDAAGTLTEVTRPDGATIRYAYDALGRRIRKTAGATETRWIWDGDVPVHELRTGARDLTWHYAPGSFSLLAQMTGEARLTTVTDHLETPAGLYDEAGSLALATQLDAYGVARNEVAQGFEKRLDSACLHRWPGQHADPEIDLYYNRFRYYDPELGHYISPDPIGLSGGLNVYGYVDDPWIWIDPLGLAGCQPMTSRAARREAMRRATIPTTLPPLHQLRTKAGYQYQYEVPTTRGPTLMVVTNQTTDRVVGHGPHWEAGRVKLPPQTDPLRRLRVSNAKVKVDYER